MTTTTTYGKRADSDGSEPALEALLTSARRAIEVTDEELTVAKARRAAIEAALRDAFPPRASITTEASRTETR